MGDTAPLRLDPLDSNRPGSEHQDVKGESLDLAAPGLPEVQGESFELRQTDGIAAGILELLGMPVPASFSQPSLLDGGQKSIHAYTDHGRWLVALRHGPWKATHDIAAGRTWLYDLRSDPGEWQDLSRVERARAEGYAEHLRAWAGVKP